MHPRLEAGRMSIVGQPGAYDGTGLRAAPDPKGGRERAAVVALALLTDGEAARLGQAACMLPAGEARNRLLTVARRMVVVGDGLLDPDLGLRRSGLPAALLEETGP